MKKPVFTGVSTAMVTPYLDNKINFPMAEQLLRRQIEAGVNTIVLAGTTGEASTLTDQEKLELFRRCKDFVGDRCKIIAGTGNNATQRAVELSQAAEECGVDGLLIVSPYYNKANDDGLFAHYLAIAHSVRIPIIMYNVPSRTGVDIPVSVYRRLSHIPNITGVKESGKDIAKHSRILAVCGDALTVWAGNDEHIVPSISLGGKGVVSVLSNIYPAETVAMAEAALDGDFDSAADLQRRLMPLIDLLFCDVNPIPVKYAMQCLGYDCGACRLPLTALSADKKEKISQLLLQ